MQLSELKQLIDKADAAYYRPGLQPVITDAEYDQLKKELKNLDPEDPRNTRVGVQYDPEELRTKVKHPIPMGSLDNTDDGIIGYDAWYKKISEALGESPQILASLKVDGGSIRAKYVNGNLVEVATRGNGEVGEDITANGVLFRNLPSVLPRPLNIDVRGEAVLPKYDFKLICEREHGIPFDQIKPSDVSNPRNVGNGLLGRDDGTDSDKIKLIAFNIEFWDDVECNSEVDKMRILRELGFQPVPHSLCSNIEDVQRFYNSTLKDRDVLPFEIDGVVVTINSIEQQNKFVTSDIKTRLRPKYAKAIKFPYMSATTILKDVLLTVGHSGAIIPTAVLEEARVGGVNVKNALLNNWDEIDRLGVAIGDTVIVGLAGDIVPKLYGVASKGLNRSPIQEPTNCPSCGEPTTRHYRGKKGAITYCSFPEKCPDVQLGKIDHWIGSSKKGVGILDIGDSILRSLWDYQLVVDAADLYTLTPEMLENVQISGSGVRIGKSRAKKICKNIEDKKVLPLHIFLGSLGVDLLGRRRVQILRESAGGELDKLEDWLDFDKLEKIDLPGFGDTIRDAVVSGLKDCLPLIKKLLSVGVKIKYPDQKPLEPEIEGEAKETSGKPFASKSFCFTGTRECIDEVEALGGIIKSSVAKSKPSPDFLVQADPTSSSGKTKNAESNGHTTIISLDYLKRVLAGECDLV